MRNLALTYKIPTEIPLSEHHKSGTNTMVARRLHVGICGTGIGGLLAGIAMAKADCKVTMLEASPAGIQMVMRTAVCGRHDSDCRSTQNAARLLQSHGVDEAIGIELVLC